MEPVRREALKAWLHLLPTEAAAAWVGRLDPELERRLAAVDRQRASRCIELTLLTGRPLTWWLDHGEPEAPGVAARIFVLTLPADEHRARIAARIEHMLDSGWIEEAVRLRAAGLEDAPALNALGYRTVLELADQRLARDEGGGANQPTDMGLCPPPAYVVPPPAARDRRESGREPDDPATCAPDRGRLAESGSRRHWPDRRAIGGNGAMKIGISCHPTYGGSGAVATELGLELAQRGHEVHFISYAQPFRLPTAFTKGVFFHEVEVNRYPLFEYPPYSLALAVYMHEVAVRHELDLLPRPLRHSARHRRLDRPRDAAG